MGSAIGAIAAPILGGIVGNIAGGGERNAAADAAARARQAYEGIALPDLEKMRLQYELPYLVGEYNPLQEQAIQQAASAMQGVQANPELAQKQMMGLQALEQVGKEGFTPQEMMAINQAQRGAAQQAQARDAAILQNMAERGMGGAGAELIARLKSSQQAADTASQEGQKTAAEAAQRRLEALQALGTQAGAVRGQEFGEKSAQAQAADAIARFNAQTAAGVQERNIAAQNAAQAANLAAKQNIQQQQTALRNAEQEKNKALYQQQFQNALQRAGGISQGYQQEATQHGKSATDIGSMWGSVGSGAGKIIGALGTQKQKPNINDADALSKYLSTV